MKAGMPPQFPLFHVFLVGGHTACLFPLQGTGVHFAKLFPGLLFQMALQAFMVAFLYKALLVWQSRIHVIGCCKVVAPWIQGGQHRHWPLQIAVAAAHRETRRLCSGQFSSACSAAGCRLGVAVALLVPSGICRGRWTGFLTDCLCSEQQSLKPQTTGPFNCDG